MMKQHEGMGRIRKIGTSWLFIIFSCLFLLMTGCGGGGGGSNNPQNPAGNNAPVAGDLSFTTNFETNYSGQLNATDADGDPLTYSLVTNAAKGVATITDATTGAYTYAPNAGESGTDSFTYKANDGAADSNTATVSITISAPGSNQPPVADAGADQSVPEGSQVTLDGSASSDTDGTITSYAWSQVSGPEVIITDADTSDPTATFIAPPVPQAGAAIVLKLTVTDDLGSTAEDEITISSEFAGRIDAEVTAMTSANYDLTDLTSAANSGLDWKFYDDDDLNAIGQQNTRKNTGQPPMISNATPIGATPNAVKRMNRPLDFTFSWSDGGGSFPVASDIDYGTIFRYDATDGSQEGAGFTISVDANENPKMLTLYLGVQDATARLQAAFDDSSQAISDILISNSKNVEMTVPVNNGLFRVVRIAFHAAAATRLTVTYTLFDDHGTASNLSILAATLNEGTVLPPTITPAGGEVTDSAEVALTTIPEDASIYYTLDGSDPAAGQPYTGPFTIDTPGTTTVRAIATRTNYIQSAESTTSFTVNASAGGLLSVTAEPAPIDEVDLSAEAFGANDCWAQWGRTSTEKNYKAACSVDSIKNPAYEGNPPDAFDQLPRLGTYGFAWSDGFADATRVASDENQRKSVRFRYASSDGSQEGDGIVISDLAADTSTRIFKLYVGANSGTGRVEASLNDGSAEPAQVLLLENPDGNITVHYVVTIRYRAGQDGQTLAVKYLLDEDHGDPSVLSLQAAALVSE